MNAQPQITAADSTHRDAITLTSPLFIEWLEGFGDTWTADFNSLKEAFDVFCHDECFVCAHSGETFSFDDGVEGDDGEWRHADYEWEGLNKYSRRDAHQLHRYYEWRGSDRSEAL